MASDSNRPSDDPLQLALTVIRILDGLGAPAWIGGSLASSIFGIPRATQDADIVAGLVSEMVPSFVEQLGEEFYADQESIAKRVARRASFNVIHLPTMFKVDVFPLKDDPWSLRELERHLNIEFEEDGTSVPVASPEDIIIHKLVWFRDGSHVSDRQWKDALGVVRVQADRLDLEYLARTAEELEVSDLLRELLTEAGR